MEQNKQPNCPCAPCAGRCTATRYDFTQAEKQLSQWYTPHELSASLKDSALRLSFHDEDSIEYLIRNIQQAVLNACDFLDTIQTKKVQP